MMKTDIAIVGAGPAGLMAAAAAAEAGAAVLLIDRSEQLGGQLIKQTHKFFGSRAVYAGERGFEIAAKLAGRVNGLAGVTAWTRSTVLGYYPDGVLTVRRDGGYCAVKPQKLVVASGAAEKNLAFANNDLPGIYGAGAVQTLMNVYGVQPARRVVMVGGGNIGMIVAYQLLQAGVEVAAVVEAAPEPGAYRVHADKVKRLGIPILTSCTVKEAHGISCLEGVTVQGLDASFRPVAGTEQYLAADGLCLAVGQTPLVELLWQAGCEMTSVPELGGYVPRRNEALMTTLPAVYVAGDAAGVEEASAAMMEGRLAGLHAAFTLGYGKEAFADAYRQAVAQLSALRAGPTAVKVRSGLAKAMFKEAG